MTRTAPDPSMTDTRITFRQPVSTTGHIDAVWWPRTTDLEREVPALVEVLWDAGREVNRLTYDLAFWDAAPRRIAVDGRTVRLGGFTVGIPLTATLTDAWGKERIDLLVLPPDTDIATAERAQSIVERADNTDGVAEIMRRARDGSPDPDRHPAPPPEGAVMPNDPAQSARADASANHDPTRRGDDGRANREKIADDREPERDALGNADGAS